MSFERRQTKQIHVGKVAVGGGAPISVQSMTTTKTSDVEGTLQQIYALAAAGCDIVRCTCNEIEAAEGLAQIVPRSPVPIIADIHHQYKMALAALEAGEVATIYRVTEAAEADAALLGYLEARGLVPGAKITVLSRSTSLDSLTLDGPIGKASLGLRPAALVQVMRGAVDASLFHQIPARS